MVEKLVDIDQLDGSDAKSFLNKHQHATDTIEKAVDAIKGLPHDSRACIPTKHQPVCIATHLDKHVGNYNLLLLHTMMPRCYHWLSKPLI